MTNFKFDELNLIVQQDGDQGDCCARIGEYYTGLVLTACMGGQIMQYPNYSKWEFAEAIKKLEKEPGVYIRHPKAPYNQPYAGLLSTSRDQTAPIIIALGFYNHQDALKRLFWRQIKHFGFFPNGKDISGFEVWGAFIRSWWLCDWDGFKKLYMTLLSPIWLLIILLGDISLLIGTILRMHSAENDADDCGDDILLNQYLCQAKMSLRWFLIDGVCDAYFKKRRLAGPKDPLEYQKYIESLDKNVNGPYSAMLWYHREASGGNPIHLLYELPIQKLYPHSS